ncbi:MAG: S8 family serine peptidase [Patescibacteria group bacterium]
MIKTKFNILLSALIIGLVFLAGMAVLAYSSGAKADNDNQGKYAQNRIIVKIRGDKEPFRVVAAPEGKVMEKVKEYQIRPDVIYAEPDYYLYSSGSNDAAYSNQWALNNTSQTIYKGSGNPSLPVDTSKPMGAGNNDADVDFEEAWNDFSAFAFSTAVVAVIDSGIDETHLDLKNKIWKNLGEIIGNRKDDDGNGFVDDVWGWDFVRNDNAPHDKYGHGTHVSGIASAETNNGNGIAGIGFSNTIRIMPIQVLNDQGSGFTSNVAKGIRYAADNGAKVINLSLGGSNSTTLKNAIDYAFSKGMVIVAAAGNNYGGAVIYPAAYENVIAVSATNYNDQIAGFSSVGPEVDVAAPGENVFSTFPSYKFTIGTKYGRARYYDVGSGTSMAAPQVTGLAGLLFAQDPNRNNATVRSIIQNTVDDLGNTGLDNNFGYGRINIYKALISIP